MSAQTASLKLPVVAPEMSDLELPPEAQPQVVNSLAAAACPLPRTPALRARSASSVPLASRQAAQLEPLMVVHPRDSR